LQVYERLEMRQEKRKLEAYATLDLAKFNEYND